MSRGYEFWVRFSSIFTIAVVSLMIITKAWAWLATGSAALLGSLTDSLLDISASLMNFLVLSYALRPADNEHRFGHGKAEALAGLAQAAFIAGSASLLIFHSLERLINPIDSPPSLLGAWVSLFAIVCTLGLVWVQQQVIKRTDSVAIKADALHYKGDILLNIVVLIAVVLSYVQIKHADPLFALLVAGYLLYNSWDIAKESADHLMDKELPDEEKQMIVRIAKTHPDVFGVHDLRTRQSGKLKFVQLHLELDDDMPLMKAHKVSDKVVESIQRNLSGEWDILVHQDPKSLSVMD